MSTVLGIPLCVLKAVKLHPVAGKGATHLHACAERSGHFCSDGNNLSNSVFVKERKISAILVHFILDLEILADTCGIK